MMVKLLLLAAVLGQVTASDGPPRQWLPAEVNGRTVQLWGWRDGSGGVRHYRAENPQVYAPPTAASRPTLPNTGMVLESNGTLNSGLDLHATQPTQTVETNDPNLGAKLNLASDLPDVPYTGPDPVLSSEDRSLPYRDYLVPGALLIGAILLASAVAVSRPNQ